jgi:anti-anti-sigma regulatory factor
MGAMTRRPVPPGILDLSIRRWGGVVELALAGDLDSATTGRLGEAVTWLRHSTRDAEVVVVDTTAVAFVSAAGYRALHAALAAWDDRPATRVMSIEGAAVARIDAAVERAVNARPRPPAPRSLRHPQGRGRTSPPAARLARH